MSKGLDGWYFCQTSVTATSLKCYGKIVGSPEPGWYAIRYLRDNGWAFHGHVVLMRIVDIADWIYFEGEEEMMAHIRAHRNPTT